MESHGKGDHQILEQPLTESHFAFEKLISTKLNPSVSGDVLESWNFLLRFREVLGLQKGLSLEELVTVLNEPLSNGLFEAHILMLQTLISEFAKEPKHSNKRIELNMPPLNDLTWPELAKRYISAILFTTEDRNNSDKACEHKDVFRCLSGDGGAKCGALAGVTGLEADALLLATSTNRIYGSLNADSDMLAVDDLDSVEKNTKLDQSTVLNEGIPVWVQDLEPVKGLKTNNGAKIKKCIMNSFKTGAPDWAREILEHAISKEVYKGNASGPTKKLVLHVVDRFRNENPSPILERNKKNFISISDVVMKHCRITLRLVAASEKMESFCKFVGLANNNEDGILGSSAEVSSLLYFRMIDMRLAAGAYCGSHEAFIEDVREFWRYVLIDYPELSKFSLEASDEFESSCIKEVVALHRKLKGGKQSESQSGDSSNSDQEIPRAPWDGVICQVCGIDQHNDKVLLCDQCDSRYYHTYCLTPPLDKVPEGNWFCPPCVANKDVEDASPSETSPFFQTRKTKNGEFVSFILNKTADLGATVREKDYWELNLDERTLLLKFLCDEMLDSSLLRKHLGKCESRQQSISIGSPRTEFMGIDFNGKLYWKIDFCTNSWIVVNYCDELSQSSSCTLSGLENLWSPKGLEVYSLGACYQSDAAMKSIVSSLDDNDPIKRRIEELLLQNNKLELDVPKDDIKGQWQEFQPNPMTLDSLKAKATKALELKYGQFIELETEGKEVEGNLRRCGCLQSVLPTGQHCLSCHRTCFTTMEKKLHGKGKCINKLASKGKTKITCSQDGDDVPPNPLNENQRLDKPNPEGLECRNSLRPLKGKAYEILTKLKINLLDMEAAISGDALKPSRVGIGRRWAWRSFITQAGTIYEMVQALIVFEDMIKPEYLNCSWRYYWSSLSAAANISTLSALSLRIYSLDAAIVYEKKSCATDSSGLLGPGNSNSEKGQCNIGPKGKRGRK
ncbi:hypothetical protein CASFOL_033052 [Castilleja foliolosa]|uniref:Uncharacterized protein n=1 Tax=Castilleja foliolosa TaxID=1961234 RepID=A0ABD3C520_9LAMI